MMASNVIRKTIAEALRVGRARAQQDPLSLFETSLHSAAVDEQEEQDAASSDKEHLQTGDVTSDDVIKKLNAIRAGRSLRDGDIQSNIEKYVNDLSKAERTALFAYLKGIEQIVSGQISADQAEDPAKPDPSVEMKKKASGGARHIKPTIIRKPSTHGANGSDRTTGSKKGAENTAPPLPVKVKG
jgi:hypothetical protein